MDNGTQPQFRATNEPRFPSGKLPCCERNQEDKCGICSGFWTAQEYNEYDEALESDDPHAGPLNLSRKDGRELARYVAELERRCGLPAALQLHDKAGTWFGLSPNQTATLYT